MAKRLYQQQKKDMGKMKPGLPVGTGRAVHDCLLRC